LDPAHQFVGKAGGVEAGTQVGLVDPHLGGDVATAGLGTGGQVVAGRHTGAVDVRGGNHRVAVHPAVAGQVLQAQRIAEVVFQLDGEGIALDALFVQILPAEVGIAVYARQSAAVEGRDPRVRPVVGARGDMVQQQVGAP